MNPVKDGKQQPQNKPKEAATAEQKIVVRKVQAMRDSSLTVSMPREMGAKAGIYPSHFVAVCRVGSCIVLTPVVDAAAPTAEFLIAAKDLYDQLPSVNGSEKSR
jgi:hypothetical protein